jgi:CrcB protein
VERSHDADPNLPVDADTDDGAGESFVRTRVERGVLAALALGAMPGAAARFEISKLVTASGNGFPWATFWTNVSGSAALGFLLVLFVDRFASSRYVRAAATTGFLGAYTTFSTFSVETDLLVRDGRLGVAVAYVIASLVCGIGAAWIGIVVGRTVGVTPVEQEEPA